MNAQQAGSYLSGLLIGEEMSAMQVQSGIELIVVGDQMLSARYRLAMEHVGAQVRVLGNQAAWAGLHQIYLALTL